MMRLKRSLLSTVLAFGSIAAVLIFAAAPARADNLIFGSSSGSLTFTGDGAGSVTVAFTGVTGNGSFGLDAGTFTFSDTTITAGPVSSNLYPAGPNSDKFTFTLLDGDTLVGTVQFTQIQDNTTQPKFFGLLTVASDKGDAAFVSTFGTTGTVDAMDFTTSTLLFASPPNGTLDDLTSAAPGSTATATISSGEVAPVPELPSVALLGTVLLGVGGILRRKLKV